MKPNVKQGTKSGAPMNKEMRPGEIDVLSVDELRKEVKEAVMSAHGDEPRRPRKEIFEVGEHNRAQAKMMGGQIEVPYSWCKGNLPLHAKQLFNAIAQGLNEQNRVGAGIKLLAISDTEVDDGQRKGDAIVSRVRAKLMELNAQGDYRSKALTSTGAGTGDELVPTDLSSALQRRFYLGTPFGALFAAREIQMPSQPFELPLGTTLPTFYKGTTENTKNQTATDPGTGKVTLTAGKFIGQTDCSYEADEDAIIAVIPFIQERLSTAAAEHYEDTLINGDTAGTQDVDDVAGVTIAGVANHHYRIFDGFRKLARAVAGLKVDFSDSSIISESNCRALRKVLKRWGRLRRDLVWVCGISGHDQFEALEKVSRADTWGGPGTIRTGELTSFLGIPIVPSAFCREDLTATGVHDGVTTTKGSLLLVNTMGFLTGNRRNIMVETDRDIETQTLKIVASFRKAFTPLEPLSATITPAGIGYNWTA